MNQLIRVNENGAVLAPEIARNVVEIKKAIDSLKEKEKELNEAILKAMEAENILKIETDELTVSYIAPTDRESLDSKALRAELPDIYDAYVKMSPVKASIRIRVR